MARYLGIDYGEKRIGLAYADELGLAMPLPAAIEPTAEARLETIRRISAERRIETIVVGYPYNMDGSIGFKAREVDDFIEALSRQVALPIERADERLTTQAAQAGFEASGRKGKRDRRVRSSGAVDSAAATLILQDFVDARQLNLLPPEDAPGED